jgi:hypothetical protein
MDDRAAPELEELYDEATVAALDRWRPGGPNPAGRRPGGSGSSRSGLAGAVFVATALAVREVFVGEREDEAVVEFDRAPDREAGEWVDYLHVPGAPHASRIVVRPWLAP